MRFLSREDVEHLSPWVWRQWKPKKYKGGLWWKLEDFLEISDVFEEPQVIHKIHLENTMPTQYVPFGKLILRRRKTKPDHKMSKRQSVISQETRTSSITREVVCPLLACCNSSNRFVAVDSLDNLYFFDLDENIFWKVTHCPQINALSFCNESQTEILIAKINGPILKISIFPEMLIGQFSEHTFPVEKMLFFSDDVCLSYSKYEAWIWNCFTFEALHSLTFKDHLPAVIVKIHPKSDGIFLTVLSDNTLHVWKRFAERKGCPRVVASYTGRRFMMEDGVTCVEFDEEGTTMALAGDHKLISFVNITEGLWVLKCILQLPQTANATKSMKFMMLPNYSNCEEVKTLPNISCLAVFTLPFSELIIYDLEGKLYDQNVCHLIDVESDPLSFQLMPSENAYAIFSLKSGFIDVYSTFWWLNDKFCPWLHYERKTSGTVVKPRISCGLFEKKLALPCAHLSTEREMYRYILRQCGQLPPAERPDYWRLGLALPSLHSEFRKLMSSYLHPACQRFSERFPSLTKENLYTLTRLYSAFCFISPVFFIFESFPNVLLQFCKVLIWSPIAVFETILTIMNNYCQCWYRDFPQPPSKILELIESAIKKKDPLLAAHLEECEQPPSKIGWELLSNFFINSFDLRKWCVLWDHIIFADRNFIIMVAASIILNSRCMFLGYKQKDDFSEFQEEIKQFNINAGSVILIAYDLLHKEKIIKNNQQSSFVPLQKESYMNSFKIIIKSKPVWKAVHVKMDKLLIEDICLQKNIDLFKLLDPREPTFSFSKRPFSVKNFVTESSQVSKADSDNGQMPDEKMRSLEERINNELIFRERKAKFDHLVKMLKNRELLWINGRKARANDVDRLELFSKFWPQDEPVKGLCAGQSKTLPKRLGKEMPKSPIKSSGHFMERPTSKTSKETKSQDRKTKRSSKLTLAMRSGSRKTQTSNRSPKRKTKPESDTVVALESGLSILQVVLSPYSEEVSVVREELEELLERLERVEKELSAVRRRQESEAAARAREDWGGQDPRQVGRGPVPVCPPPQGPVSQRREEFLALVGDLHERLGYKLFPQ